MQAAALSALGCLAADLCKTCILCGAGQWQRPICWARHGRSTGRGRLEPQPAALATAPAGWMRTPWAMARRLGRACANPVAVPSAPGLDPRPRSPSTPPKAGPLGRAAGRAQAVEAGRRGQAVALRPSAPVGLQTWSRTCGPTGQRQPQLRAARATGPGPDQASDLHGSGCSAHPRPCLKPQWRRRAARSLAPQAIPAISPDLRPLPPGAMMGVRATGRQTPSAARPPQAAVANCW
jgi:hypothetical protein